MTKQKKKTTLTKSFARFRKKSAALQH